MKLESPSSSGHAARLLALAATPSPHAIPTSAIEQAKWCLLDAMGCGLFGASQPWGRLMADEVLAEGSSGHATICGHDRTVAAAPAALCNGTAMHGFELDDLIPGAIVHPGTIIVPAVLAAAEAADADGAALLRSIVIGYEAIARLSRALGMEPSHRGFHKTAVVGPVAAAIAAGNVLALSPAQLACATGLACSMASGIKAFASGGGGGMVKRMHAGRAAEAGVRAAQLAQRGFTGPATAIDGHFGLLDVYAGKSAEPHRLDENLGGQWAIADVWVKVYPICGWIQGVAQLLLDLRGPQPLAPERIRKVVVGTSAFAVKNNAIVAPEDTMEAQYSIPYCVAVALTGDPGDPQAFDLAAVGDPAKRRIAERVELKVDAECDAVYPGRFGSRVALHLDDGSVREALTLDPHGTAVDPCTEEELVGKFARLARLSGMKRDPMAVVQAVRRLDAEGSTRALTALMRS